MRRDANFCRVCGNETSDASTLRLFRRYNHEAIEHCLREVLRFMAGQAGAHPTDAGIYGQADQPLMAAVLVDMNEN